MKLFATLAAALIAAASARKVDATAFRPKNNLRIPVRPVTELEYIAAKVNAMDTTWTAEAPTHRFATTADVAKLCRTWGKHHPGYVHLPDISTFDDYEFVDDVPSSYDARQAHAACTVIGKIRDQSSCGSCWSFGSTECFEDRRCIATKEDVEFSAEDTASCCRGFSCGMSNGCNGGQPTAALHWMSSKGVVTGGDYPDMNKGTGCRAYSLAPCAHHVPPSPKYPACPKEEYHTPQCEAKCESAYTNKTYEEDKTKSARAFSVHGVEKIKSELVAGGPLSCAFTVYSDFPTYKSGVYQRTAGSTALGGHAVEIIGYGTESGTDYWLVKNSWNEEWGDGGTFKILRGKNECGIEDEVAGVSF
jgi:cathepsin B